MEKQKVIMSGMRPTGRLHLGNYMTLRNWVRLQNGYQCFYSIVDWHALTTGYEDTSSLQANIKELLIDYLSAGLDPEKNAIYLQSDVKEIAELHLLFSMTVPLSWLERCPTYKEQLRQLEGREITNYGFLGYPVLQAADILVFKADAVPVGEDQLPHLELTREIARRFNFLYKTELFPEPKEIINEVPLLPGIDARKMSKSYGNTIALAESPDEVRAKVKLMVTDPARVTKTDPGHPEVCTVFAYNKVFRPDYEEIAVECRGGKIGCVACKKRLAETMVEFMAPMYERRQALTGKDDYLNEVLHYGAEKARAVAKDTLEEVREAMNLTRRW